MEGEEDRTYMIWVVEGKLWVRYGVEKGGRSSGPGWIDPKEGLWECITGLERVGKSDFNDDNGEQGTRIGDEPFNEESNVCEQGG